ncbi:MAG: hypothetical protein ABR581_05490 [Thermoleophilaceae bacterium]
MDASIVLFAVSGWIALDAAIVGVMMLFGRRRERRIRALAGSLVAAAERHTREAAASGAPVAGIAGHRIFRGPIV